MTATESSPSSAEDINPMLDGLFANAIETIGNPFPGWNRLRSFAPVYRYGSTMLVSSHSAARTVLLDKERFSGSWLSRGGYIEQFRTRLSPKEQSALDELLEFEQCFMRFNDDPEHARIRGLVQRTFLPRQVATLGDQIRRYCDEQIDEWSESEVIDLMELAYKLPLHVICEMIGVPPSDHEMVHDWSGRFVGASLKQHPESVVPAHDAMVSWREYMKELLASNALRKKGRSLFLDCLFEAMDAGQLDDEGAAAFCINMLFGGHEGPTNLISIGMYELMRNWDQWQLICNDPTLIASGVDELLRYVSPNEWERRIAVEDTELDGTKIHTNQIVFPILAAANRDPSVFPDPERLDLQRTNASEHLAFSFGIHHCLGAVLARLEMRTVLKALTARHPLMELAIDEIAWINVGDRRRIEALPVRIGSPST